MKKLISLILICLLTYMAYSETVINPLTKGQADILYCSQYGNCILSNLSIIGGYFNVTVTNIFINSTSIIGLNDTIGGLTYWNRTGTNIYPKNIGDTVSIGQTTTDGSSKVDVNGQVRARNFLADNSSLTSNFNGNIVIDGLLELRETINASIFQDSHMNILATDWLYLNSSIEDVVLTPGIDDAVIISRGDFGIGTHAPSAEFELYADSPGGDTLDAYIFAEGSGRARVNLSGFDGTDILFYHGEESVLGKISYSSDEMDITASVVDVIGNLRVNGVDVCLQNGSNCNITSNSLNGSLNSLAWNRSGTNVILHNTNDQVGIGVTSPNDALDISSGDIDMNDGGRIHDIDGIHLGDGADLPGNDYRILIMDSGGQDHMRFRDTTNGIWRVVAASSGLWTWNLGTTGAGKPTGVLGYATPNGQAGIVMYNETVRERTDIRHRDNGGLELASTLGTGVPTTQIALLPDSGGVNIYDDTYIQENLNITGNFTGNQLYGEMFAFDAVNTVNLVNQNEWVNVGNLSKGSLHGFTFNNISTGNATLQPIIGGKYLVHYSISYSIVAGNDDIESGVGVNNIIQENTVNHRGVSSASIGVVAGTGILDLNPSDRVTLMMKDEDLPINDPIIDHVNFVIHRIGN